MTQSSLKHIVFVAAPGMTHIRPSLHFCARLAAKFPNLFISVYTPGSLASQADKYLSTYQKDLLERVKVVPSVVDIPLENPLDIIFSMERSFGPWISGLLANSSIMLDGLVVDAPTYIIEDHINGGIALANEKHHRLPVIS
ncbi:hypothetical protein FRC07_009279, partial [Ceratobasidium sp. 392]